MNKFKKLYVVLASAIFISSLLIFNWESLRIRFELWRAQGIISYQDTGWGGEVEELIGELKSSTSDKRQLAEILLSQSDGSLVAEGMVIVVQERFPDGNEILSRYANDKRWNYWFQYNKDFSRMCLSAWKIKMNKPLTSSERDFLSGWKNTLEATFKIEQY